MAKLSPFDYLKILTEKTKVPEQLDGYSSYMMNKIFSCSKDLCLIAVEANKYGKMDEKMNFDLYNNVIPKGKYYIQYNAKKIKEEEMNALIAKHYLVSLEIAKEYNKLLSEQEKNVILELYQEVKPQKMSNKKEK